MARSEEFRQLLIDAVYRISACEGDKPISVVQDELGYALNKRGGGSAIEYWRQGNIPKASDLEKLVQEIIRRSDLDTTWARQFLKSAKLPYPEDLWLELFPRSGTLSLTENSASVVVNSQSAIATPPRLYRMLVGREELVEEIVTSLNDQYGRWLVTIDGIGGIGKTALALEVLAQCKKRKIFDVVVWVNCIKEEQIGDDKQAMPRLTIGTLLNSIANQLDAMRTTYLTESEKETWVKTLLQQQQVLIVIDNLEVTVEQQTQITSRIQDFLNPSKALLISRKRFAGSFYAIHLEGLGFNDARTFIDQESKDRRVRQGKVGKSKDVDQIIKSTGGSPLAMKLVIGQLSYLPIKTILKHLQEVTPLTSDTNTDEYFQLYRIVYDPSWRVLSEGGKTLLVAMSLFLPIRGVTIDVIKAVSAMADEGVIFHYLSELWNLSLVEAVRSPENSLEQIEYYIHTLTQYFVLDIIAHSPDLLTLHKANILRAVNYLLDRSRIYQTSLFPEKDRLWAMHVLSYAFQQSIEWSIIGDLLITLAPQMEQAGYRDDWIPYLNQGLERSRALQDIEKEAELNLQLGILYQRVGKYSGANEYYTAGISKFVAKNDIHGQAEGMIRQAQVFRLQRRFDEANELVELSFKLLTENDVERARGYTVLGEIANDDDKYEESAHLFEKALNLWRRADNQRMIAWNLTNLGAALYGLGRYQDTIKCYTEAISILGETADPVHWAVTNMNLGNVSLMMNDPQAALGSYELAETIFRKTQDILYLAMIDSNRGIAYRKLKLWQQAREAYQASIKRYQQIGNVELEANALDGLGLVAIGEEEYKEASRIFTLALNLLEQFKSAPGWSYLHKEVQHHLQESFRHYEEKNKGQRTNI